VSHDHPPHRKTARDNFRRGRFRCFATKLSANDLSFLTEILARRRFAEPKTAKTLAVLSLFSAVLRPDRIASHAATVLAASAGLEGRPAIPSERPAVVGDWCLADDRRSSPFS
jgi:hypothetical protein